MFVSVSASVSTSVSASVSVSVSVSVCVFCEGTLFGLKKWAKWKTTLFFFGSPLFSQTQHVGAPVA